MWKTFISTPFQNCNKIHPLQQKKVRALLDAMEMSHVEKVEVFGSSVSNRCHVGSDVDIYVTLDNKTDGRQKSLIKKYVPYVYDVWTNDTVDERLLSEIKKNSVTVYQKEGMI